MNVTMQNAVIEYKGIQFVVNEEEGQCYYRNRHGEIFAVPLEFEDGLPNMDKEHRYDMDRLSLMGYSDEYILDLENMVHKVLDAYNKNR